MPVAEFEQFRIEVLRDPALQRGLIGVESREEFVARVVKTGAERGYKFTEGDVEEALRASQAEWVLRWV